MPNHDDTERKPSPSGTEPPGRDRPFRTTHLMPRLGQRSLRGGVITMGAQAVKLAVQITALAILARLLTPEDFGLFAILLALLTTLELFKDLGLSSATVQRAEITEGDVSSLFWLNLGLGTFAAIVFAALAPALATLYDAPEIRSLGPVVALSLVMTGAGAQHLALLRREMRFGVLAAIQAGGEVIGLAAAIAAAYGGLGVWALVIQRLVWGAALLVGPWVSVRWVPGRPRPYREVRGLIGFGANATGAMVLGRLVNSADKILIGWVWNTSAVGLFERAQKLTLIPVQNINMPLATVALPMLSRLTDDRTRYRAAYFAIARRLPMLTAPAAALCVAAPVPVVTFVLGQQWQAAAPILGWLGISLLYAPVTYTLSWLYMSQDRTGEMLRANIFNAVVTLTALGCAVPFGVEAVAAAYALSGLFMRAPVLFLLATRRGPIALVDFAGIMALPAAAAVVSAVVVAMVANAPDLQALSSGIVVLVLAATAGGCSLVIYATSAHGRGLLAETLTMRRALSPFGAK